MSAAAALLARYPDALMIAESEDYASCRLPDGREVSLSRTGERWGAWMRHPMITGWAAAGDPAAALDALTADAGAEGA